MSVTHASMSVRSSAPAIWAKLRPTAALQFGIDDSSDGDGKTGHVILMPRQTREMPHHPSGICELVRSLVLLLRKVAISPRHF